MTDETNHALETTPPEATDDEQPGEDTRADLAAIRELVLRAHPDVVPELIGGSTVDDLMASIEPAQAAYQRLAASLKHTSSPPTVPAGGQRPIPVDPDRLSASEKIRRGLAR